MRRLKIAMVFSAEAAYSVAVATALLINHAKNFLDPTMAFNIAVFVLSRAQRQRRAVDTPCANYSSNFAGAGGRLLALAVYIRHSYWNNDGKVNS